MSEAEQVAVVGFFNARHHTQQRALSDAVRSDDTDAFTCPAFHGDFRENLLSGVAFCNLADDIAVTHLYPILSK